MESIYSFGYDLDRKKTGKTECYLLFSTCRRMASSNNLSPSSFETGRAILLSDFQTFSLSSKDFAWAKGFRSFGFLSILQIYSNSPIQYNKNVQYPLRRQLLSEEFFDLGFQYLKQSARSFFWSCIRRQWYRNLSVDNLPAGIACVWDYPEQSGFQPGLSYLDSLHPFRLNLKNLFPYLHKFYINEKPEENKSLREIFGPIYHKLQY